MTLPSWYLPALPRIRVTSRQVASRLYQSERADRRDSWPSQCRRIINNYPELVDVVTIRIYPYYNTGLWDHAVFEISIWPFRWQHVLYAGFTRLLFSFLHSRSPMVETIFPSFDVEFLMRKTSHKIQCGRVPHSNRFEVKTLYYTGDICITKTPICFIFISYMFPSCDFT